MYQQLCLGKEFMPRLPRIDGATSWWFDHYKKHGVDGEGYNAEFKRDWINGEWRNRFVKIEIKGVTA